MAADGMQITQTLLAEELRISQPQTTAYYATMHLIKMMFCLSQAAAEAEKSEMMEKMAAAVFTIMVDTAEALPAETAKATTMDSELRKRALEALLEETVARTCTITLDLDRVVMLLGAEKHSAAEAADGTAADLLAEGLIMEAVEAVLATSIQEASMILCYLVAISYLTIRMAVRKQDMPEMGMQGLPCYPGMADKQEQIAHNETLLESIQTAKPQML